MPSMVCLFMFMLVGHVTSLRLSSRKAAQVEEHQALYDENDIHLVFSTDCGRYQSQQAELLAYSAMMVGQKGRITRVAAGCRVGKTDFAQLRRSLNPNYIVHVSPDYSNITNSDAHDMFHNYPFFNKVFGLQDWLENASPPVTESVIVMLDPDQMLLSPFSPNGRLRGRSLHHHSDLQQHGVIWGQDSIPTEGISDLVKEGVIVSQAYGQGVPWAGTTGKDVSQELAQIIGKEVKDLGPIKLDEFSVGMPTAVHILDARKIFKSWADFVVPTHNLIDRKLNTWTADMQAWEIAVWHHGVKQLRMNHLMISNIESSGGEAFDFIDDWHRDTCHDGPWGEDGGSPRMPYVLHYCQGIPKADQMLIEWENKDYPTDLAFHKKHVPSNLLECKAPMMIEVPENLRELDSGKYGLSGPTKRVAWMACAMMKGFKAMTLATKDKFCMPGFNTDPVVGLHPPDKSDIWGKPIGADEEPFSKDGLRPIA